MKTSKRRFRLELLALACTIACALAIFISTTLRAAAGSGAKPQSGQSDVQPAVDQANVHQTYEGVITDTHCGAKHSAAIAKNAADCTLVCVHSGEHFALVDGDQMYILKGEAAMLKHSAGQRVKIDGTLNGHIISVASISAPIS